MLAMITAVTVENRWAIFALAARFAHLPWLYIAPLCYRPWSKGAKSAHVRANHSRRGFFDPLTFSAILITALTTRIISGDTIRTVVAHVTLQRVYVISIGKIFRRELLTD